MITRSTIRPETIREGTARDRIARFKDRRGTPLSKRLAMILVLVPDYNYDWFTCPRRMISALRLTTSRCPIVVHKRSYVGGESKFTCGACA